MCVSLGLAPLVPQLWPRALYFMVQHQNDIYVEPPSAAHLPPTVTPGQPTVNTTIKFSVLRAIAQDRTEDVPHLVSVIRLAKGNPSVPEMRHLLHISESASGLVAIADRSGFVPLCEQLCCQSHECAAAAEIILERLSQDQRWAKALAKALTSILTAARDISQLRRATSTLLAFVMGGTENGEAFVYNLGAVDALVPLLGAPDIQVRQNALVVAHKLCGDVIGTTVRIEACGGRLLLLKTLLGCAGEHEKATALDLVLSLPGGRHKVPLLIEWVLNLQGIVLPDGDAAVTASHDVLHHS